MSRRVEGGFESGGGNGGCVIDAIESVVLRIKHRVVEANMPCLDVDGLYRCCRPLRLHHVGSDAYQDWRNLSHFALCLAKGSVCSKPKVQETECKLPAR